MLTAVLLAGCHKKAEEQQIVARGKSFEVTIPEFDQLLRRAPAVTKAEIVPTRTKLLNVLIDQKLFAQAAIDQKLDRDVDTMQDLEAERRRVLATAYVTRLFSTIAKPTSREVQAYYDAHPKSYAQRRVYTINQVGIEGEGLPLKDYQDALEKSGMKGLDARLAQDGIDTVATNVVISSDMLPPNIAAQMEKLSVGSPIIFNTGATIHLGSIVATQDGTLSLDMARPLIEQRIGDERREALIKSQAERLRKERDISVKSAVLKGAKPQ